MTRKALSKRTRFEVFKRDGFKCCYCGARPPEVVLAVDHIIPVAGGGSDEPENLTTSCFSCNAGKGAVPLGKTLPVIDEMATFEALQELGERRVALMQQAHAAERFDIALDEAADKVFWWWWEDISNDGQDAELAEAFQAKSVRTFLEQGMTLQELRCAVSATYRLVGKKPRIRGYQAWKYFCAVCWNIIRKNDEPL